MSKESGSSFPSSERRSFLMRFNAGAAGLAAIALSGVAKAQVKTAAGPWAPARHDKDDWLEVPGKHRMAFDTITPDGLGLALAFAANFMRVNRSDYGLENSDLAIVIVVRHLSVAFGYNDAMWAKYGAAIAGMGGYEDPKSKTVPKINVYNAADYADAAPNRGVTLDSLSKQGVRFAVCSLATRAVAGVIARAVGGKGEDINNELIANLVSNARMVPAGIVAVNRAQERGYSIVAG